MKRIFKIKRVRAKAKITDSIKMQWRERIHPAVRARIELLPKQRTSNGDLFVTLNGARKIVSRPVVEFYAQNLYEALNKVDFREISDITISSSVTSYDGFQRRMPLIMDQNNQ